MKILISLILFSSLAGACIDFPHYLTFNQAEFGKVFRLVIGNWGYGTFTLEPRKKGQALTMTWNRGSGLSTPNVCFGNKGRCEVKGTTLIKDEFGKLVAIANIDSGVIMIYSVKGDAVDSRGPRLKFLMKAEMDNEDHFYVTSLVVNSYIGDQQVGHFERNVSTITTRKEVVPAEEERELVGFSYRPPTLSETERESKIIGHTTCGDETLIMNNFLPMNL